MKNFGNKGAWAYPGTAQFFRVPPIISGTGKAYIHKLLANYDSSPVVYERPALYLVLHTHTQTHTETIKPVSVTSLGLRTAGTQPD